MTYDQTGSEKSNMVAFEEEVTTFQVVDKIGTKSQRQFLCFGVQLSDGIGYDAERPNRKLEIQDGGL